MNYNEIQEMIDSAVNDLKVELEDAIDAVDVRIDSIQTAMQLDAIEREHTPLTANEMHPDIDDTPEDWDEP